MGKDYKAIIRNRHFVNKIKTDSVCADCAMWFPACAMDFDHVTGVKVKSISRMVQDGQALDVLTAEIAKCEVVCACCHRIRTEARR